MALVKDYFDKTKEWSAEYGPNTVVLMQVGAFFEVYGVLENDGTYSGSRIADVSEICDLLISNKASGGMASSGTSGETTEEKLPVKMSGFRDHQIDKYLRRLNDAGWTCVVYTQDAATKNTTRSLMGVFSPGTFFSDETSSISNNAMVVWIEQSTTTVRSMTKTFIGIAVADIFTGRTYVSEYTSKERHSPTTYDDIERSYSVYAPSEVIIVTRLDDSVVSQVVQYTGMDERRVRVVNPTTADGETGMTRNAKNSEKQAYQVETINTFFRRDDDGQRIDAIMYDMRMNVYGFQALVFLLNYIYAHNPNLASKIELPVVQKHSDKLTLANHSLKQLNMVCDDNVRGSNAKMSSVSSLLNSAVTAGGKRTFASMLHNPICDVKKLRAYYDITESCLHTGIWKDIREHLKDIKDLEKLSRKLVLKRFTPRDVAVLLDSIRRAADLREITATTPAIHEHLSDACGVSVGEVPMETIIEFIEGRIVADEAMGQDSCGFNQYSAECVNKGSCFIREGISEELDAACKGGLVWQQQLEAIVAYFAGLIATTESTKTNSKAVKVHETPTMPPAVMLTKRRSAILKLELAKLAQKRKVSSASSTITLCAGTPAEFEFEVDSISIDKSSSKTEDVINSSQIRDITFKMRNSKEVFNDILTSVFKDFCHQLSSHINAVTQTADFVRHVDVIQTRCHIADRYCYCKPVLVDSGDCENSQSFVRACGLRHPLIEHIQTNELYVTNDVSLGIRDDGGCDSDDGTSGILLFGTNAVGKTSIIKALGISVIMAQAGLYVACSSFTLRPYTAIFTRILGNDNIHRGLSTFAVEMLELRTILKMADKASLILGDELCSGTESDSALSIFAAGIERLHTAGSSFIFATHFHEIVDYDEVKSLPNVKAKHMTVLYDRELDLLVYDRKLKDGPGESMYGLEVCKALDLPQDFLDRAHSLRSKYNKQAAADTDMGTSHFNARKVLGRCELCGKAGTEVHHLQHQSGANEKGRIKHFHKNHLANLISLCGECHDAFHSGDIQYEWKKTTKGYKLMPANP